MSKIKLSSPEIAQHIVDDIIDDITDRCGIGNELEQMDSDCLEEMKDAWKEIISHYV